MGKVTISSEEYKNLLKGGSPKKKGKGVSVSNSDKGKEAKIIAEINELQKKKAEISTKLNAAKAGKGFFKRQAINIGAAGSVAQINKAINEKKRLLQLLKQKDSLEVQRDVAKLGQEVRDANQEAREAREEQRRRMSEDVFDTKGIFG